MSAPIDDLLYGGDDSGDEDMSASMPMRSFSTPLPLASGLAPLPLAPAGAAPLGGPVSAAATVAATAKPLAMATPAPVPAATPPALRPAPFPPVTAAGQPAAAGTAVGTTGAAPAAKASGSGQQMFQQMFALLKQMLPAEQYATLHSEMRKGNGNDIKSIVDIIKRIAGDAIFSSVIQKMDLTRSFPSNPTPAANAVKTEAAVPTPSRISPTSSALTAARTGAAAVTAGGAIPVGLPLQMPGASSALGSAAGIPTSVAQTAVLPATSRFVKPAVPTASLGGAAVGSTAALKPAGPISSPSRPAVSLPGLSVGTVKPEPSIAPTSTPPPSTTTNTSKSTGASPSASPSSVKNEALEKILYAKRLLLHASTCSLEPGVCQFKKCDDVRRVFKHSASCGGANGCTHCEQLKGLVKYHAKECQHSLTEHCAIPFCDGLRRAYMSATAALGGVKSSAAASQALAAAAAARKSSNGTSDDEDDNTPLASVSKKKNPGKAKSPKSAVVTKVGPTATVNTHKKKPSVTTPKAGGATASPSNASQVPSTPATAASSTGAPGNAPNKAAATVTANMTLEYGRLLQLILHVQKCSLAACPVGKECADAKSLLQQINSPNAPARAKTYKQVYAHYKLCVAKNNTSTCPMCKIGLRPILPVTTTAPASSPGPSVGTPTNSSSQSPGSQTTKPVAVGMGSGAGSSVSPLKRTNSMTTPSPRSPKKARTGGKSKVGGAEGPVAGISVNGDIETGIELVQASITDIRKEADVLTHTGLDLTGERRIMMGTGAGHSVELLPCKKEEWVETDLFESSVLTAHMRAIGRRCGVTLGAHTSDVMAYALREYLKQVMEEMVEVAKQRSDAYAQSVALPGETHGVGNRVELTATDILRVSCEDSFSRLRQEDLAMRATLLEDAKREEMIERERAKKRKKVDRSKLAQEEKDEAEMDIEELATKDLKERLLREDKEGVTRVDGRVNESISRYAPHRADHQVTMEDAAFWLHKQRPYVKPKLFARAEVARIVTKALN